MFNIRINYCGFNIIGSFSNTALKPYQKLFGSREIKVLHDKSCVLTREKPGEFQKKATALGVLKIAALLLILIPTLIFGVLSRLAIFAFTNVSIKSLKEASVITIPKRIEPPRVEETSIPNEIKNSPTDGNSNIAKVSEKVNRACEGVGGDGEVFACFTQMLIKSIAEHVKERYLALADGYTRIQEFRESKCEMGQEIWKDADLITLFDQHMNDSAEFMDYYFEAAGKIAVHRSLHLVEILNDRDLPFRKHFVGGSFLDMYSLARKGLFLSKNLDESFSAHIVARFNPKDIEPFFKEGTPQFNWRTKFNQICNEIRQIEQAGTIAGHTLAPIFTKHAVADHEPIQRFGPSASTHFGWA